MTKILSLTLSLVWIVAGGFSLPAIAATGTSGKLAATPPMGWNDWAHYRCGYTADTILANARALVKTGLAARGYDTVTIDDCWMLKDRDARGNLQADPERFPNGIKPIADAVHALGLTFGIYEDAGWATCDKRAGSGVPQGGGKDHFLQDTRLFASWGVDYLKLDGCNVYVPPGSSKIEAFRKAYQTESAAIKTVGRPIVFSESAPAYFQYTPDWYDVLTWVRYYGQLWREGSDVKTFHPEDPDKSRFPSVLWNYAYNLPLGRFQKPGNWNDADFIIGGDRGMTLPETRSQVALWSMMSAPLILSSDVAALSPQAISILGNRAVLAIDQDPLGKMATLVRRNSNSDVLLKRLKDGEVAVAVLNHGPAAVHVNLRPGDLGFAQKKSCRLNATNLWTGKHVVGLEEDVAGHDSVIWRVQPSSACGKLSRTGTLTLTASGKHESLQGYTYCLADNGSVEDCAGTAAELWTVTPEGSLKSGSRCLGIVNSKPVMQSCAAQSSQRWKYTLVGNLKDFQGQCLTASQSSNASSGLSVTPCGHNQPDQIWSLPN